ncbi:MAG: ethanolamine ammonia-lyase reactivating factor EutA [Synergistaceae bacterium]|jgi:ethanolamine utilization protein EutA|nr:ethanolamine ammonia-lyase reactivating factor EutA [Synergistaceae bacterium]
MHRNIITSVGIDIGTSTTQVVFANLALDNTSGYFAVPHVKFVGKTVLYKSPIRFTPLKNHLVLDDEAIRRMVLSEYESAGMSPRDIDTGAVIITGESARKENAARLLESLSDLAGEFVVSTAGPDLEAVIAGKGSGAQRISEERGICVVNFDIGGGTTNIAAFDDGETIAKGCLDIGGRLIRIEDGGIAYVSGSARRMASSIGLALEVGDPASADALRAVCGVMTGLLEQAAGISEATALLDETRTPGSTPFAAPERIDAICFSGGVADCLASAGGPPFRYGDVGPILGELIAGSGLCRSFKRITPEETIRATVVGAGSYTTTVSGSTISHGGGILPIKNIPALKLERAEQEICFGGCPEYLRERMEWFLRQNDENTMLLAIEGEISPSYSRLKSLASCVYSAMSSALPEGAPLLIALERDMAKALGQLVERMASPGRAVICVDSVHIEPGDYVDLGHPLMGGLVIPVVVKTLAIG